MASVTTSCSPGVSWTDADLRHLSRPWARDSFIAATITSAGPWGTQGTGIVGLPDSCPSPGSADRSVFPARTPQHAWERVNTLLAARADPSRGGTVPLQGESCLLAGGLDLSTLEAAGCVVGPGGQRFPDCSDPPATPTLEICPRSGIVRRRNQRDLPFTYCALVVPRISRRGRRL